VLDVDAAALISTAERPVGPNAQAATIAARRRIAREPVSRIVGWREFYGRKFEISPATLDPRPDTETLIDAALAIARSPDLLGRPLRILDVGTGSGCLIVTLLAELDHAIGMATDISPAALELAQRNAAAHGVSSRMTWQIADAVEGIDEHFDMLLSNPPYIPTLEIAALAPEVRQYDPALALNGGVDGLAIYRRIVAGLVRVLPNGYAFFEVGSSQAIDVAELLRTTGRTVDWPAPSTISDLSGNVRCVAQRTRQSS
jgi:release factor glutamine methyltransferase